MPGTSTRGNFYTNSRDAVNVSTSTKDADTVAEAFRPVNANGELASFCGILLLDNSVESIKISGASLFPRIRAQIENC